VISGMGSLADRSSPGFAAKGVGDTGSADMPAGAAQFSHSGCRNPSKRHPGGDLDTLPINPAVVI
jgi:hypothetical protein